MTITFKKVIFSISLLSLVSCGDTPTSQLTDELPITHSGPHNMEFSQIPAGFFQMGSPETEPGRNKDETLHWVKLTKDYEIQTKEMTRGQWFAVMGEYPPRKDCGTFAPNTKEDHPITCVSWDRVHEFLVQLNSQNEGDGYSYRLPTEAEWEYAARANTTTPFSIEGPIESFARIISGRDPEMTLPVGSLKANGFGLYDVHGNVHEWVSDWSGDYEIADSKDDAIEDPKGPASGSFAVIRSNSWLGITTSESRSAFRTWARATSGGFDVGFRIIRTQL